MNKTQTGIGFLIGLSLLAGFACETKPDGEKLAHQYCGSCHLFPEPALLDKKTWTHSLLPEMAKRLGVGDPDYNPYASMSPDEIRTVMSTNAFPSKPLLSKPEWAAIVQFYTDRAPETPLPQEPRPMIDDSLTRFAVRELSFQKGKVPVMTYLGFNPQDHLLYAADRRNFLYRLQAGKVLDSLRTDSPVTDLDFDKNQIGVVTIGVMDPNDEQVGGFWSLSGQKLSPVLQHLNRPVNVSRADLNQDGLEDLVICQHGNFAGSLSWYENLGNGSYREHPLRQLPGARLSIVTDWNHDGKPDILGLFGQAREGVYLFTNLGNGNFDEKALLEFPPVYGSSFLELADMDGDGFDDLVYTNGDNADYSISLKKYHGIRIYLNDGHGGLKAAPWFFPVNGASKVLIRDFDHDGDPDMALISFFAAPGKNDSFLYFENEGRLNFKVSGFPGAVSGRWLVACAGDIDNDGDDDIVIGSFLLKSLHEFKADPKNPPPALIVLENRTIAKKIR